MAVDYSTVFELADEPPPCTCVYGNHLDCEDPECSCPVCNDPRL